MGQSEQVKIRLSDEEKQLVRELAEVAAMSQAEFVRRAALGVQISAKPIVPDVNIKTYAELGRIGNSLNQLAHQANADRLPAEYSTKLAGALSNLSAQLQQVRRELVGVVAK